MKRRTLLLWLEAPLQSWGYDSKFSRRDTLEFPTRSGVLGILLCALGAQGEQKELLSILNDYSQTVYSFVKNQRETLLCDFHMVGSGYDERDPWASLLVPKTSDGKKSVGGGSKLTYRYYLQDAKFGVILDLPNDLSNDISVALQNPVYDLYLGRKCCIPTDFIYRGTFSNPQEAEAELFKISTDKGLKLDFKVVPQATSVDGDTITLNDVPIQFGKIKKYKDRRVTIIRT